MQRKIIISLLILILLILLWRSCKSDHKQPEDIAKVPELQDSSKVYIDEAGIYLVDKNWTKRIWDSIQKKESHLKPLASNITNIVFITTQNDSIEFSLHEINRKEPLIFFTAKEAPFLSNLKNYHKTFSFFYPKITLEPDSISQVIIEIEPPIEDKSNIQVEINERIILSYNYITPKKYESIEIPSRERPIYKKDILELANRDLYYPLINDNQFLELGFDNDFWDYTDYYYTNGVYLNYIHPFFVKSPLSYLLVSNRKSGLDYYGITLTQNMYTGLQPKVDSIVAGDRPWSAYTTIGQNLISFDRIHKMRHYSEINLGILGPESGGGYIQDLVHTILPNNSPPQGWDNQIATDFIFDYQYQIRTLLYEAPKFESYVLAGAQIGTLRDNIKWGFGGKYGVFIPFYEDIAIYNRTRKTPEFNKKIRFHFIFEIETKLIAYDATLQGGMFNKNSIYALPANQINRFVIEGIGGIELSFGRFDLQFIQHWKSKEFETGKDHKYVRVRLKTAF